MATVLEQVQGAIRQEKIAAGVEITTDEIDPGSMLIEDLGFDSLTLVGLIMSLEEEFSRNGRKLEISEDSLEKVTTVQDIVDLLKGMGVEDGGN